MSLVVTRMARFASAQVSPCYESTIVSAILDTNKKPPFVMSRAITKVEPDSITTTTTFAI